jgi:hypothetical protein
MDIERFGSKRAVISLVMVLSACVMHTGNPNTPYPHGWSPRIPLNPDCRELAGRYKYVAVQVSPDGHSYNRAINIFSMPPELWAQRQRLLYPHLMSFEILIESAEPTRIRIRYLDHESALAAEQVLPGESVVQDLKVKISRRVECRDGKLTVHFSSEGPRLDMQHTRTLTRSADGDLIAEMLDVGKSRGEGTRNIVNDRYWVRFR